MQNARWAFQIARDGHRGETRTDSASGIKAIGSCADFRPVGRRNVTLGAGGRSHAHSFEGFPCEHVARDRTRLEAMEERVLLSPALVKPATAPAIMASKTPKPFTFNGNLPLKLTATYSGVAPGFREKKPFPPMGEKVKVSGTLAYPGSTSSDGLPDLSGSTFELSNASGKTAGDSFIIDDGCLRLSRSREERNASCGRTARPAQRRSGSPPKKDSL